MKGTEESFDQRPPSMLQSRQTQTTAATCFKQALQKNEKKYKVNDSIICE